MEAGQSVRGVLGPEPSLAASPGPSPSRRSSRRVIANPISGERIVVRRTASETDGELFEFDVELPPGAHVPAGHAHPRQEERFTVLEGRVKFRVGLRSVVATEGGVVVVPRGRPHWFGNAGDGPARLRVEARPALRTQELFEATETISRAGHVPGTRLPRLSDLAAVLAEFDREVATPYVPERVMRILLAPFARFGRWRGALRRSREPS